ncbi:MAG: BspA family leucine-rich repeat surface protein, partial [Spirochaetales bacterium]|nr:BspA family leucine-rich repeat surface protein [Spirochaetales bacterium]
FHASVFNQNIGGWDVQNVTSLGDMFRYAYDFNQDLSGWDTSNATSMYQMFYYATSFDQDVSDWDISSVTTMAGMFYYASAFTCGGITISDWVWDMTINDPTRTDMFSYSGLEGNEPSWY